MQKTILIPIDFRVASLNTLKYALENSDGGPNKVILLYAEFLDDSITELLFYRPENKINALMTKEFMSALEVLKNRFEFQITELEIRLLHNQTKRALIRFVENNEVDEIFVPKTYRLKVTKKTFDIVTIIRYSNLPYQEIDWAHNQDFSSEKDQLEYLFNY
ncbi:universal stress protein [Emticicia sp. 17c]|uniref:universal stress protein n=1 Tax=Emticicia sp. 17c TaxID=3127704 RepID=UPI00301D703F